MLLIEARNFRGLVSLSRRIGSRVLSPAFPSSLRERCPKTIESSREISAELLQRFRTMKSTPSSVTITYLLEGGWRGGGFYIASPPPIHGRPHFSGAGIRLFVEADLQGDLYHAKSGQQKRFFPQNPGCSCFFRNLERSWNVLSWEPCGDRITRSCRHTAPDPTVKTEVKDRIAK